MGNVPTEPRIAYQAQLDLSFGRSIATLPGTEDLFRCIQCGTCSSTCPVSAFMDYTPRRIIALTRAGFADEVLSSNTIWLCSSCYSCTVECPKQIRITDIMYSLKRRAIQTEKHARMPTTVLAGEFMSAVMKTGRSNEARIITWTWLKTRPFELLKQAFLGLRLWLKGRISIGLHKMTGDRRSLSKLLMAASNSRSERRGG